MSVHEDSGVIDQITRMLQIIIGTLLTGLVMFLVIVVVVNIRPKPPAVPSPVPGADAAATPSEPLPVMTVMAYTFAVILLPLSLVVPKIFSDAARTKIATGKWNPGRQTGDAPPPADDLGKLAMVYQARKIMGAAMNEGAAFLALIAYMLERNNVALGLALALMVCLATRFPLRAAVANWLEGQLDLVRRQRQSTQFS